MITKNPKWMVSSVLISFAFLPFSIVAAADPPQSDLTPTPIGYISIQFPWQNDSWNFKPISPDDLNKPVVEEEIKSLVSRYQTGGIATAVVNNPVELQTGATQRLFPGYKFYMIGWDELPVAGKPPANLAMGIHYCLAVSEHGSTIKLWGMNDPTGYGKFLADNGITIKSIEDARAIWLAYCDIAAVPRHSQDLMKTSPTEWHMGINMSGGRLTYFKFTIGPDQKVISAE